MEIGVVPFAIFLLLSLCGEHHFSALFVFFMLLLVWFITHGIGFADIFVVAGYANFLPFVEVGTFLIIVGITAGLYAFFKKKIPLLPFVLLGAISLLLIKNLSL